MQYQWAPVSGPQLFGPLLVNAAPVSCVLWLYNCFIRPAFYVCFHTHFHEQRSHSSALDVTISMNMFPLVSTFTCSTCGYFPPSTETPLNERLFHARVAHTNAPCMHTILNLWRQWKCLATTKRIPRFCRHVSSHMKIHFLFRGNVRWNVPLDTHTWKARGEMIHRYIGGSRYFVNDMIHRYKY